MLSDGMGIAKDWAETEREAIAGTLRACFHIVCDRVSINERDSKIMRML